MSDPCHGMMTCRMAQNGNGPVFIENYLKRFGFSIFYCICTSTWVRGVLWNLPLSSDVSQLKPSRSYLVVALGCRCPSMLDQLRWLYLYADFPWISCPWTEPHTRHNVPWFPMFLLPKCVSWVMLLNFDLPEGKPHFDTKPLWMWRRFPLSTYNRKLFSSDYAISVFLFQCAIEFPCFNFPAFPFIPEQLG